MRILQLHNAQLGRGGADIQMEREADGLERRGHAVDRLIVDNHEIEEIGRVRAAQKAIWNSAAVRDLRRSIEEFCPDVVHVVTPFPLMSPAVFVVAHRLGLPVVTTSQSHRYNCVKATLLRDDRVCEDCVGRRLKLPAIQHRCYKGSLAGSITMASTMALHGVGGTFRQCVDRYLALTPFMRERIIAEGIPPHRVVVKPNSAPDPGPPLAERDGFAMYAGRFVREKGIRTLLEAWEDLERDLPLLICGAGELQPDIEAAAARDPRIQFEPWLDSAAVTSRLRRAEVLMLPSEWYEGLPVILTEAFAAGTPIISSDVGNFTDLIEPGVNGARFRTGDSVDLRDTVRWFVDEADRGALRRDARASFEANFEGELVLDQLESIYAEVIAERS